MESSDDVRSSDEIQTVRLRRSSRGSPVRSNSIRVDGRRRGEEGAAVWSRERDAPGRSPFDLIHSAPYSRPDVP
jgi:hypothetical protein